MGYDRTAQEIFKDSFRALLKALKSGTDPTAISSVWDRGAKTQNSYILDSLVLSFCSFMLRFCSADTEVFGHCHFCWGQYSRRHREVNENYVASSSSQIEL